MIPYELLGKEHGNFIVKESLPERNKYGHLQWLVEAGGRSRINQSGG